MTKHHLMMTTLAVPVAMPRPFDNPAQFSLTAHQDARAGRIYTGINDDRRNTLRSPADAEIPAAAVPHRDRVDGIMQSIANDAPEIAETRNAKGRRDWLRDQLQALTGPFISLVEVGIAATKANADRFAELDKLKAVDAGEAATEGAVRETFRALENNSERAEFIKNADVDALTAICRAGPLSMPAELYDVAKQRHRKLVFLDRVKGQSQFKGKPSLADPFAPAKADHAAMEAAADSLMKNLKDEQTKVENLAQFVQRLAVFCAVMADVTPEHAFAVLMAETSFAAKYGQAA